MYNWVHNKVIAVTSATTTTVLGNVKAGGSACRLFTLYVPVHVAVYSHYSHGGVERALAGF